MKSHTLSLSLTWFTHSPYALQRAASVALLHTAKRTRKSTATATSGAFKHLTVNMMAAAAPVSPRTIRVHAFDERVGVQHVHSQESGMMLSCGNIWPHAEILTTRTRAMTCTNARRSIPSVIHFTQRTLTATSLALATYENATPPCRRISRSLSSTTQTRRGRRASECCSQQCTSPLCLLLHLKSSSLHHLAHGSQVHGIWVQAHLHAHQLTENTTTFSHALSLTRTSMFSCTCRAQR